MTSQEFSLSLPDPLSKICELIHGSKNHMSKDDKKKKKKKTPGSTTTYTITLDSDTYNSLLSALANATPGESSKKKKT